MSHEAPKAGVVSVSKGFRPAGHYFLKLSIPCDLSCDLILLGCFLERKRVTMAGRVWGAGERRQAWEEVENEDPVGASGQGISWEEP